MAAMFAQQSFERCTATDRSEPNLVLGEICSIRRDGRIPDLLCGREPIGPQEWKLTFSLPEIRD